MSNKITDEYLRCKIKKLRKSAEKHRRDFRPGKRRFGLYDYLTDVYAIFLELQSNHVAKKAARRIAKLLELSIRRRAHPIRILIEASAGPEDPRQKSRWTQALRYVLGWRVGPEKSKRTFNPEEFPAARKNRLLTPARLGGRHYLQRATQAIQRAPKANCLHAR